MKMPLNYLPGVCKQNSAYSDSIAQAWVNNKGAIGRCTDMNYCRYHGGYPEKIGGWSQLTESTVSGVARGVKQWRDNTQIIYLGIGTNQKLYVYSLGVLTDITPLRPVSTGTISNAISTTDGQSTVTITHTAHGQQVGDWVILTAASAVGGITVAGVYQVASVVDANDYTIVVASAATSTASDGGGNISFTYYRITLSNPFTTTSGSKSVKVTQSSHGAAMGDFVEIAGASAVGGVTPSGEYQIASIIDANNYTINVATDATSAATGGGSPTLEYCISTGSVSGSLEFGYGVGGYGEGGFGESSTSGIYLAPRIWSLDNYGQQLLASPINGTIYVWDPVIRGRAYQLYNAPSNVLAMFVTPERFVFAVGTGSSGMNVQWPDQNDYTAWTVTETNTADIRTLGKGSYCVGGLAVRDGASLVWTNTTIYPFTYSGDSFVYDDTMAGEGSELIGPLACATLGGSAYWMSLTDFWLWNGSVQSLASDDIREYVFSDINLSQSYKFVAGMNKAKKEVWFFYCSLAADEIDSYVIYHIDQVCWSIGKLQRTSWTDAELFTNPIGIDASGIIYNHETGTDANGTALDAYITFSPADISKGDRNMDLGGFIPDFERQSGDLTLTVNTQTYPQDPITSFGPYTIAADDSTPQIDLRVGAKLVGYTLQSNVLGGDFRLGVPRVEVQPAGARR